MRLIDREELQIQLDAGSIRLVMTLGSWAFAAQHIPGSLNFDGPREAFAALDRDDPIVVYCFDERCPASTAAYQTLIRHGYRDVRRYAGGLADWAAAGLRLEGAGLDDPGRDNPGLDNPG